MSDTNPFYSELAPLYHLIFADWDASMARQAAALDDVIRELWRGVSTVLDVSCGIGTQAIGLAAIGYDVTASDLCPEAVERAGREAAARGVSVDFSVADMRRARECHRGPFDLVISCDNSVPHLLSDEDILTAFRAFHDCTRPGGGCIVGVRDYEKEDLTHLQVRTHGVREWNGARWLVWQVWDPHPPLYDVAIYFVEDRGGPQCATRVIRSKYYAVGVTRLAALMRQAGFSDVRRLDGRLYQPLIIGTRREDRPPHP